MVYGSVCSGIEAASVAWHPLGWTAAFLSEIEAFPRAVLAHHYPGTPLHGDFTTIQAGDYEPIDLLVGGTPCQSFSVAGLRGGMADERGNLALEYLRLADRLRPRWLVWENVPGVLSATSHDAPDPSAPTHDMEEGSEWVGEDEYESDENHAFSCFLAGLSELGYGFAYRVLDAQFFGLAQRRKRVFVVGYLGDWRRAAAVLFEPASLRWNSAPSREAGEVAANALTDRPDRGGGNSEGQRLIAPALRAKHNDSHRADANAYVTHSLRADGFDVSEDGTGRGTPLIATALRARDGAKGVDSDCTDTLVPIAFDWNNSAGAPNSRDTFGTLCGRRTQAVMQSTVRRLTPRECERLQGFPDDYTLISMRGKLAADGPRYRALGNSMAVPCMAWIGRRIHAENVRTAP